MEYINNSIYIVPSNIKKKILLDLNKQDKLYDIKFMSLKDLDLTYDKDAITYLKNKYNLKVEVALVYLNNIKYVDIKDYKNEKLNKLVEIKKDLLDKNLISTNNLLNKQIVIYGYDYIPRYYNKFLNNYKFIKKNINNYIHDVYEFNDIYDEIEFVSNKILDLINSSVDINKIKIANINDDYIEPIKRIFKLYNIPINISKNNIYDTVIVSDFIKLLSDYSVEESLEFIKNKYDLNNENNNYIYNKIISILNSYNSFDLDLFIYDLKHTSNNNDILENSIEIIDIKNNIIDEDEYVFLMSFNLSSIPIIYKDEDYLSDKEKELLDIETSKELNKIEKENIINIIKSIKNLTITYKLQTPFDKYLKSYLVDELNMNIIHEKVINKYSNKMNYIKLSNKLDNLIKYNEKDNDLDILYNTYSNIKYLSFDNKFNGINKEDLYDYLDHKLKLSYSTMDKYYDCSFKYYLECILNLSKDDRTIFMDIGNIFHNVLSKAFNDNFDFETEFNNSINFDLTKKDIFFLNKLKEELKFIIETIKYQNTFSSLDKSEYEKGLFINKEGNVKLTFMGFIDKLMYKEDKDNTYLVIIDYKTGNPDINLNNSIYGLDMQLPVYLYLAKNTIKNAKVLGIYLQRILNNEIDKKSGKTYESLKKENLKLVGYSTSNESELSLFDKDYSDSKVIKSMNTTSKGFGPYAKVLDDSMMEKLEEVVEDKIDKAFTGILDADFKINPKVIGGENHSCKYCKYKDVCYKKNEDLIYLDKHTNLDFLKGGK